MYSPPLTVTSFLTVGAVVVLHIAFGESASHSLPYVAVVESWVAASCCIQSVANAALVVVASVDSIYCLLSMVYGVVVPLVVQHPSALSCIYFGVPTHHVFSCCVGVVHA